jgi:hypothetical protein
MYNGPERRKAYREIAQDLKKDLLNSLLQQSENNKKDTDSFKLTVLGYNESIKSLEKGLDETKGDIKSGVKEMKSLTAEVMARPCGSHKVGINNNANNINRVDKNLTRLIYGFILGAVVLGIMTFCGARLLAQINQAIEIRNGLQNEG